MSTPVAQASPAMCSVVAPATLKAGATFEATVEGKTFTATVPEGGVSEGDTFEVPYPDETVAMKNEASAYTPGSFRRGFCGCCEACCCPFLMAWCCTCCVFSQVQERLNFGWCGSPRLNADGTPDTSPGPPICMTYAVIYTILIILGSVVSYVLNVQGADEQTAQNIAYIPLGIFGWFLLVVGTCTRLNMRKKYEIKPTCCGDNCCGDCLSVYFCPCCTATQMVTHTHEDGDYKMCSRNGLTPGAAHIV